MLAIMVTFDEIEHRWLGGYPLDIESVRLVASFNRVEGTFGRAWLDQTIASGTVGPAIALPLHVLGEQLAVLQRAVKKEKLIARLQKGERAAHSELHALAVCTPDGDVEIEIEPEIQVGGGPRVPDFRLRRAGEQWVHVEVTAPTTSLTAEAAQSAAVSLVETASLQPGTTIQIRFRREPNGSDLESVVRALATIEVGDVVDREAFVVHSLATTPEIVPVGGDEEDRPIYGCMRGVVTGEDRAAIVVRVPYTDERARQVLDAEAKQLPKEGPGLICVRTHYGRYWRQIVSGERSVRLATTGQFVANHHARTSLPDWLRAHLDALPPNH